MKPQDVIESLVYLDNGFIANFYEATTGKSPETKITKTDALSASVKIPMFGGGASSTESRAFSVSTTRMLIDSYDGLNQYSTFQTGDVNFGQTPVIRWVEGRLSVHKIKVTRKQHTITIVGSPKDKGDTAPTEQLIGEETYFGIHASNDAKFALLTSSDYFLDALDTVPKLLGTVVDRIDLPVRALIKVFPAASAMEEWIACPLVIVSKKLLASPM